MHFYLPPTLTYFDPSLPFPLPLNSLRSYLCESLVTVARLKEKSSLLLESLAASLAAAFSPYEVVSASARRQCSRALLQVSSLARQGYLLGDFNTSQKVADLVSEFTVLNENTVSNITTQAIYPINTAVSNSQMHKQILIHLLMCLNVHTYFYCDMHIFIHFPPFLPLIPPVSFPPILLFSLPPSYPLVIFTILLHSILISYSPLLPPSIFMSSTMQLNALVKGVETGMAAGEIPVRLVTPNIQLTIISSLLTDIGNSTYSIPPTLSQTTYGAVQSEIILGPEGLNYCPKMGSYAQLSVLQWSTNPYAASKPVLSPLLRFSSIVQADSAIVMADKRTSYSSSVSTYTDSASDSLSRTRNVLQTSNTYKLPNTPAYLLLIQFSSPRNFDFSAAVNYTSGGVIKARSNYTLPVCTRYDSATYGPCKGCDISSYTNYNVTYSCYDVTQICPSGVVRRRLQDGDEDVNSNFDEEGEGEEEGGTQDGEDVKTGARGSSVRKGGSRELETTDDDDSGATSSSPATYGMLAQAVVAQLSSVLSSNPFSKDLSQSSTVLVFSGCLTGFIGLILIYLLRKDRVEKMERKYLRSQTNIKARKLLEEDIKHGRKGDRGVLYHGYLSQFKREVQKDSSMMTWIARTARSGYLHSFKRTVVGKSAHKQAVFPSINEKVEIERQKGDDDTEDDGQYHNDTLENEINEMHDSSHSHSNSNINSRKPYLSEAIFTEFMHKLFPGHAIFSKKTSALFIIAVNHDYLKTFGGSSMTHSRTVRFIELVSVVLVSLFVDTVFFSVFYSTASCNQYDTKVKLNVTTSYPPFLPNPHSTSYPPFLPPSYPPPHCAVYPSYSFNLPPSLFFPLHNHLNNPHSTVLLYCLIAYIGIVHGSTIEDSVWSIAVHLAQGKI